MQPSSFNCITFPHLILNLTQSRQQLEDLKESVSTGRVAMQARRDSEAKTDFLLPPEHLLNRRFQSFDLFCLWFKCSRRTSRRLSSDVSSLLMTLSTSENAGSKVTKLRKQKSEWTFKTDLLPSLSKGDRKYIRSWIKPFQLLLDPRCWSRDDVSTWLDFTVRRNNLPMVTAERFGLYL